MKLVYIILQLCLMLSASAQTYTSYRTGNSTSTLATPSGGVCLMGGASEDDEGMRWFLQRANGGDVLVLRTSGADGYNNYMYSQLGVSLNSVETIVCHNASSSTEAYIQQRIQEAEAIWFAGGDQWTYISYWRNTAIAALINDAVLNRNIVIGGTSAGMAILGEYYFSAQNGTITSAQALGNPYHSNCTPDVSPFILHPLMQGIITDTHFDNPDRRGRLATFMARLKQDFAIEAKAIACDEYTAVCIAPNGIATVYGGHPAYDDNAYFVSTNCELPNTTPETCVTGTPLTWNLAGNALAVYRTKGTSSGTQTLDLNNWQTGNGGVWERWAINNGSFNATSSTAINCGSTLVINIANSATVVYPNPSENGKFLVKADVQECMDFRLFDMNGKEVNAQFEFNNEGIQVHVNQLCPGMLFGKLQYPDEVKTFKVILK